MKKLFLIILMLLFTTSLLFARAGGGTSSGYSGSRSSSSYSSRSSSSSYSSRSSYSSPKTTSFRSSASSPSSSRSARSTSILTPTSRSSTYYSTYTGYPSYHPFNSPLMWYLLLYNHNSKYYVKDSSTLSDTEWETKTNSNLKQQIIDKFKEEHNCTPNKVEIETSGVIIECNNKRYLTTYNEKFGILEYKITCNDIEADDAETLWIIIGIISGILILIGVGTWLCIKYL